MAAHREELLDEEPPVINPYAVLSLEKDATDEEVKKAYRKAALKHHPDKAPASEKDSAHAKFQEVAFAYAILSSPTRRKRYDTTGSTAETISANDDDFSWADFFAAQFAEAVSLDSIAAFAETYKGSEEERGDVLRVYQEVEGDWDALYEHVILSDCLEDDDRYRAWVDQAIADGAVEQYAAYAKETAAKRKKRAKLAKREASEAEEYAKELGVHDKLFKSGTKGKGKGKGKAGGQGDEDALAALIKARHAKEGNGFLDKLEAKYAAVEEEKPKTKYKAKSQTKSRNSHAKTASNATADGDSSSKDSSPAATKRQAESGMHGAEDGARRSKRAKKT